MGRGGPPKPLLSVRATCTSRLGDHHHLGQGSSHLDQDGRFSGDSKSSAWVISCDRLKLLPRITTYFPQHLAAQKSYNNLDISVGEALKQRSLCLEGVLTCHPYETMEDIIDRIAREQVGWVCVNLFNSFFFLWFYVGRVGRICARPLE